MRRWSAGLICEPGASEHAEATSRRARASLRLLGPVGEVVADGQGVWVPWARHPFARRQQVSEQIPGSGRVPRLPSPARELIPGGQRARVLWAKDALEQ